MGQFVFFGICTGKDYYCGLFVAKQFRAIICCVLFDVPGFLCFPAWKLVLYYSAELSEAYLFRFAILVFVVHLSLAKSRAFPYYIGAHGCLCLSSSWDFSTFMQATEGDAKPAYIPSRLFSAFSAPKNDGPFYAPGLNPRSSFLLGTRYESSAAAADTTDPVGERFEYQAEV